MKKMLCYWAVCLLGAPLGADFMESVLFELQGVGLEIRNLNIQSDNFELTEEEVELRMVDMLRELDVRLLSDIELDVMPGQPFLEVGVDLAHIQGPSHMYVVELELREMARLERPKESLVDVALSTWERKAFGVANRPEAILAELERLLRYFADEMHEVNISDD